MHVLYILKKKRRRGGGGARSRRRKNTKTVIKLETHSHKSIRKEAAKTIFELTNLEALLEVRLKLDHVFRLGEDGQQVVVAQEVEPRKHVSLRLQILVQAFLNLVQQGHPFDELLHQLLVVAEAHL